MTAYNPDGTVMLDIDKPEPRFEANHIQDGPCVIRYIHRDERGRRCTTFMLAAHTNHEDDQLTVRVCGQALASHHGIAFVDSTFLAPIDEKHEPLS